MKFQDIREPGFYWCRGDEHRAWSVVYVARKHRNPNHPGHLTEFAITERAVTPAGWVHETGEFIGPIEQPPR